MSEADAMNLTAMNLIRACLVLCCLERAVLRYGKGLVMPLLGRYGDVVPFNSLPPEFQTPDLAQQLGATAVTGGEFGGEESCGSPGM